MFFQTPLRILFWVLLVPLGIFASGIEVFNFLSGTRLEKGQVSTVIALSFFLVILLLTIGALVLYYQRQTRYVRVLQAQYKIAADIERLCCNKQVNQKDIEDQCRPIVTQLACLMGEVSKKKCSVCIKTITFKPRWDGILPTAETLCRDEESINFDRENKTANIINWVFENTAFQKLHLDHPEKHRVFFSNYLPFRMAYENTSFQAYGGKPSKWPFVRWIQWQLPYRSTIIVSVLSATRVTEESKELRRVIGFLCIDCNYMGAFYRKLDEVIVKTIADSLTPIVQLHFQFKANQFSLNTTTQGGLTSHAKKIF